MPTDGFYEWTGPKGHKRPFFIHPAKNEPAAFAGLWETWLGADGTEIDTVTVLTREPNEMMANIHNRMPQFVNHDDFTAWLDCENVPAKEALALLKPTPETMLEALEVSKRVNNPNDKAPDVQEPLQGDLF